MVLLDTLVSRRRPPVPSQLRALGRCLSTLARRLVWAGAHRVVIVLSTQPLGHLSRVVAQARACVSSCVEVSPQSQKRWCYHDPSPSCPREAELEHVALYRRPRRSSQDESKVPSTPPPWGFRWWLSPILFGLVPHQLGGLWAPSHHAAATPILLSPRLDPSAQIVSLLSFHPFARSRASPFFKITTEHGKTPPSSTPASPPSLWGHVRHPQRRESDQPRISPAGLAMSCCV